MNRTWRVIANKYISRLLETPLLMRFKKKKDHSFWSSYISLLSPFHCCFEGQICCYESIDPLGVVLSLWGINKLNQH